MERKMGEPQSRSECWGLKKNRFPLPAGGPVCRPLLNRPNYTWSTSYVRKNSKPGIDCALLPLEAVFVALPRKVDTMLPRATERTLPRTNLARVEPNRSDFCPAAKGFQCAVLFKSRRSCVWGTASRGCRASMLDTNTVNKRTSLPRTKSCERQPRPVDTQPKKNRWTYMGVTVLHWVLEDCVKLYVPLSWFRIDPNTGFIMNKIWNSMTAVKFLSSSTSREDYIPSTIQQFHRYINLLKVRTETQRHKRWLEQTFWRTL
jgi:hypothetical protein